MLFRRMRYDIDYQLVYAPSPAPAIEELLTAVADSLDLKGIVPLDSINSNNLINGFYFACVVFEANLVSITDNIFAYKYLLYLIPLRKTASNCQNT